jgi:acetamidase/formamidase
MATTYRIDVLKDQRIAAPQLRRAKGSLTPRVDGDGWYGTFGVETDLLVASQAAVRAMIEHLGRERGLSREDAYILCALAGDLKITEVVDAPMWMVAMFMPDAVFVS